MTNKFNLPFLGYGMGLRPNHYNDILGKWPKVDWFEVITENFMESEGKPKRILQEVLEHYPVVLHGVSLSIGSTDPLNMDYLAKLKNLIEWVNPPWVSDHLCWTGINKQNSHDLLPVPYTEEALEHVVNRIKQVQDYLGRPILIENPSTYLEFKGSGIPEQEFIARMAEEADCALLLDVNNVYVSCYNHRLDVKNYLDILPFDRVAQIHLAGHHNAGTHIIDTHDNHVVDEVWEMYKYVIRKTGEVTTMVEWDDNIPDFNTLCNEVEKARTFSQEAKTATITLPELAQPQHAATNARPYEESLHTMHHAILDGNVIDAKPAEWIRAKKDFPPDAQLDVYIKGYRYRLFDVVSDNYPALRYALGDDAMNLLIRSFIQHTPSKHYNISNYIYEMPEFILSYQLLAQHKQFAYELACAEAAMSNIFDMPESATLTPEAFSQLTPEQLLGGGLHIRTAAQLFAFTYPINNFLHAFHNDEKPEIPALSDTWLVVFRDEETVWRLSLDYEEYILLTDLANGMNVGEAMEHVSEISTLDENALIPRLQVWFGRWVHNHLLAA